MGAVYCNFPWIMSVIVFSMTGNTFPCATSPQAVGRNAMGSTRRHYLNVIFQSLLAQKFSIRDWLKHFTQGLVDLKLFFKRDRDRDEIFSGKV